MLTCDPYLLFLGETDKSQFWDSKGRGGNGGQTGELLWDLHDVMYKFTEGEQVYCFTLIGGMVRILKIGCRNDSLAFVSSVFT